MRISIEHEKLKIWTLMFKRKHRFFPRSFDIGRVIQIIQITIKLFYWFDLLIYSSLANRIFTQTHARFSCTFFLKTKARLQSRTHVDMLSQKTPRRTPVRQMQHLQATQYAMLRGIHEASLFLSFPEDPPHVMRSYKHPHSAGLLGYRSHRYSQVCYLHGCWRLLME